MPLSLLNKNFLHPFKSFISVLNVNYIVKCSMTGMWGSLLAAQHERDFWLLLCHLRIKLQAQTDYDNRFPTRVMGEISAADLQSWKVTKEDCLIKELIGKRAFRK